jgi:hypothetical protein
MYILTVVIFILSIFHIIFGLISFIIGLITTIKSLIWLSHTISPILGGATVILIQF